MSQPQREPIPYPRSKVQVIDQEPRTDKVIYLNQEVKDLQEMSTIPVGSSMRRLIFVWFRVFVIERKRGKVERVNVKIPIPIPIIGAMFSRQLSLQKAAKVAEEARRGGDVSDYLESTMGFEFIRVEDDHSERDKRTLVVIGLD